jgi:hypothetical protein
VLYLGIHLYDMSRLAFWKRKSKAKGQGEEVVADDPTSELFSTAGEYGLKTLAEPENACVEYLFMPEV